MICTRARVISVIHRCHAALFHGVLLASLAFGFTAAAPGSAHAAHHRRSALRESRDLPPVGARPIYESIVLDVNSGRVLHQVNADEQAYPASLTKMMTLYMLFDALQKGKVHLDTPFTVSAHAASQAPSKLGLVPGSRIAVEQAIYAIVTKSANDVAVTIAENLGGTEEHFCALMTAKAHALGMTRSQFRDASGLPNRGQLSTARDMAILGRHLIMDFPQYYPYFSHTEFPYNGMMIHTHNHLLEEYDGADGIKTGYTAASGFNLVASARRGDRRLITVMFGGTSARSRDQHVAALMDAGFDMLTNRPEAVAAAQSITPFPPAPEAAPTTVASSDAATAEDELPPVPPAKVLPVTTAELPPSTPAATTVANTSQQPAPEPAIAAGDTDDPIGQEIAAIPTPPLAPTAELVPPPGSRAARHTRAVHVARRAFDPPSPNHSWGIQVGAFANRTLAENKAAEAERKLQTTLPGATTRIVAVRVHHHRFYRAQVVGLNRREIAKACHLVAKIARTGCKTVLPDPTRMAMR